MVADPDAAADLDAVAADADEPQPTFTPAADAPVDSAPVDSAPDPNAPTLNETDDVPVVPAQAAAPVTEVPVAGRGRDRGAAVHGPAVDFNEPLLGDPRRAARELAAGAGPGLVYDPRAAVADAAELVEHTAQTLIGSLQQRQRALRTQWDNNGSVCGQPVRCGRAIGHRAAAALDAGLPQPVQPALPPVTGRRGGSASRAVSRVDGVSDLTPTDPADGF